MVLMDAVCNLAPPHCCAANLIRAAIALNDEQVASAKPEPLNFTLKKFDLVYVPEIKRPPAHISYA